MLNYDINRVGLINRLSAGGALQPSFSAVLQSSLLPGRAAGSPTPTFTRATTAMVWGYAAGAVIADGPTLLSVASGEARFVGARRVSEGVWSTQDASGVELTTTNGASALYGDASGPFGYFAEGSRTNRCLQSQVFSNAAWVSGGGGITVTDNSIAAPDGTTTADTLTAAGANGTLIQDLGVVASASKTGGLWLKRKTGTGNIDLTMDGGATWTTVAVDGTWTRFSKNQTLADEDFGIRIVTSGDEVYAWQAQVETAAFLSSAIPTTTAAVTRNADVLSYVNTGNFGPTVSSVYAEAGANAITGTQQFIVNALSGGIPLFIIITANRTASSDGTTTATSTNGGSFADGSVHKVASAWDAASSRLVTAKDGAVGTAVAFDGSMGGTAVTVGNTDGAGGTPLFGTIRNLRIYSTALSDAAIQAMTA